MLSKHLSIFLANCSVSFRRNMSSRMNKTLLAVCQMTSKQDKQANFEVAKSLIEDASDQGCHMVFLPECFDMVCESRKETIANSETIDGQLISQYKDLARNKKVWLALGGLHERNANTDESGKVNNAHIVINHEGEIASIYRKTHLFNLDIPGTRLVESEFSIAGDKIIPPVQTPVGKVGLGICYDVRFAEFAIALAKSGADILTYPSSFTVPTGLAHWESLMRTRAIETQCYVVSAAQVGAHNAKRSSYGHAMVVDPWGCVIAQCSEKVGFAVAEIDLNFIKSVRQKLPVWTDRRPELYGEIIAAGNVMGNINDSDSYNFGQSISIPASQVFYKSAYSYAFVNHRPVLPGHVLISPLRYVKRLTHLKPCEVSDLFNTVQVVQRAIEKEYEASSSTIAIQDGPDAGQSIDHLHVHLLPRKPTDFGGKIDQIYAELQTHDKEDKIKKNPIRTKEDMDKEALKLRSYFN